MSRLNWEDKGLMIDRKTLTNLRFADNVLISNNTAEMNQLMNELNEVGETIRLEINMKKTPMMTNQWCDCGIEQLDGIPSQKVDSYVHLGREINMMNDLTGEIGRRRKLAWAVMGKIREITDQIKDASRRAHLLDSTVLLVLCYATET